MARAICHRGDRQHRGAARRGQNDAADSRSAHVKAAAEKRLDIHPAGRNINELHVETVFLERAGLMGHPDACDGGPDYGIGQAKRCGRHFARTTKPEHRSSQKQFFHAG